MQKHEDERITLLFCQNSMIEANPLAAMVSGRSTTPADGAVSAVWASVSRARAPPGQVAAPRNEHGSTGTETEAAEQQISRTYALGPLRLFMR